MTNDLYVNYVRISNLDDFGNENDVNYAVHVFNDNVEVITHHAPSFEESTFNVGEGELLDYLCSLEGDFYETLEEKGGLYFNQRWISIEGLTKAKLIKQCRACVPSGYGPIFENMTIAQLEKYMITFRWYFQKKNRMIQGGL